MSNLWLIVSHKEVALAQGWVISEKGPLTGTCDVKWNTALIAVSHTCGRLFVESGLDKLLPHSWWSRTASAKSSATCAISSSRRLYREDRWSPGWCWELGCLCAECHRQLCCTLHHWGLPTGTERGEMGVCQWEAQHQSTGHESCLIPQNELLICSWIASC